MADLNQGSQYGGLPGPLAPPPHDYLEFAHEQARLTYETNPANPASSLETAYAEAMKLVER